MSGNKSELIDLELVADVVRPIELIVWGELAMHYLGVPTVVNNYMFGMSDDDMDLAAQRLAGAGFVRQNWSFSSTVDPTTRDDEIYHRIQESIRHCYANFDAKTIRFHHTDKKKCGPRIVLIAASYIRLNIPTSPTLFERAVPRTSSQPSFYVEGNLYYPNAVLLLQSFIMVWLKERGHSEIQNWQATLAGWAIGYLYGELTLRDDVLDTCTDNSVKESFNEMIERGRGRDRTREKFGREKEFITNDLIKDFQ